MRLTSEQKSLLENLNLPTDFDSLDDDSYFEIYDKLNDELIRRGINDAGDGLNDYGELCRSTIIALPDD